MQRCIYVEAIDGLSLYISLDAMCLVVRMRSTSVEELIRRELGAVALALSQQQRDTAQESLVQAARSYVDPRVDVSMSYSIVTINVTISDIFHYY